MPATTLDEARSLHRQQRFAEAETAYRQWLAQHADDAGGWLHFGHLLLDRRRGDEALAAYQRHLALLPTSADGHVAMGNLLLAAERPEQATAFHRRAVALKPDSAEGWQGLARALAREAKIDEAIDAGRQALELRPDATDPRRLIADLLLTRGDLAEGWRARDALRPAAPSAWNGATDSKIRLRVRIDGDMAEALLLARLLPAARARVGRLTVDAPNAIAPLIGRCAGVDGVNTADADAVTLSLADLPARLNSQLGTLGPTPWLKADRQRAEAMGKSLQLGKKQRRIGVAGLPFAPDFLTRPDVAAVRLPSAPALPGLIDPGIDENSWDDLAALIVGLDLVIGGDGPVLRLAAGLGVPVWAALSPTPDWPWMAGRPDTPWFPTARLFRQFRRDSWAEVAKEMAEALDPPTGAKTKKATLATLLSDAQTLHRQGRVAEAAARYRQGLALDPQHPALLHMLGLACHQLGQSSIGAVLIRQALARVPDAVEAWNNLGVALRTLGRLPEAIIAFAEAVRRRPGFVDAHYNLGNARQADGDAAGAEAAYRQAIAIDPRHSGAHYNLGNVLRDQHRLAEAIATYRQALAQNPNDPEVHQSLALALLLAGDYAEGFDELEWRWRAKGINRRDFSQPAWDGKPFAGRRLYLHAEQGLGDSLQFIRYVPQVKALGGEVIVEAQRGLLSLLARMPGIDRLVPVGDPPPEFDLQAPLMSLPRLMGTRLDNIPTNIPYLGADRAKVNFWRPRLDAIAQGALKVGLVWAGSPAFRADHLRSPRLTACMPLFDTPHVKFFGLQLGDGRRDLDGRTMPANFTDLGGWIGDFEDTAAVMGELDLMISSCTAPVHLAGALGVPTWVILPHVPDWRWLLNRADSPWYPSVQLFRQTRPGDWGPVIDQVGQALRQRAAGSAVYLNNQANRLSEAGQGDEAVALYRQAMAAAPRLPQIPYNLANALSGQGRAVEAEAALRHALAIAPDHAPSMTNLGALLMKLGRSDEALDFFDQACARIAEDPLAHYNRATALQDLERYDEALTAFDRALAIKPDLPMALNNKGACLRQLGRLDEAATLLDDAAARHPDSAEIHNNLGLVRKDRGEIAAAMACHRRAVAANPDHAEAHWNLALTALLAGDFATGWPEYEWRWKTAGFTTPVRVWPMPEWRGEPLSGRRLIVHCEQGFGDNMQFARYVPLMAAQGAEIIVESPQTLIRLFASLAGVSQIITADQPRPEADFHIPLLSLPLRFGTRPDNIPAQVPYLHAPGDGVAAWRRRLAAHPGMKIGLVWSGDPRHGNDRNRSIPLSALAPAIERPGATWVALQKGPGAAQLATAGLPVLDWGGELNDFADTAALATALDLVISVDTSVVHVAGALGRPVWIMLPFVPDFRWLMGRADSPWYPSARLFRQSRPGDWPGVIRDLIAALEAWKS